MRLNMLLKHGNSNYKYGGPQSLEAVPTLKSTINEDHEDLEPVRESQYIDTEVERIEVKNSLKVIHYDESSSSSSDGGGEKE
jgi:hypothetical protein